MRARSSTTRFRRYSVADRLHCLRAAAHLKTGGLLAHHTATVPGVAASPFSPQGVKRMRVFKQRAGPFLLLAADVSSALRLALLPSPLLRHYARQYWPGPVTLVFRAKAGLPAVCYHRGSVAVRLDASPQVRQLAACSGGYVLSSSLNRRGRPTQVADRRTRYRLTRWLRTYLPSCSGTVTGMPSRIYACQGKRFKRLR